MNKSYKMKYKDSFWCNTPWNVRLTVKRNQQDRQVTFDLGLLNNFTGHWISENMSETELQDKIASQLSELFFILG